MKTLRELYKEHEGKASDKWSLYLEEYDRLFADFRSREINLLEIGVQNGGSLEVWSKYFKNAKHIIGCDINEKCRNLEYKDPRIKLVIGNAAEHSTKLSVLSISDDFDIVIDDGSHKSSDIVKTFSSYFEAIKPGGLYVAEDLHCSYWRECEGGLYDSMSSMNFFKRLADVLNREHWGNDESVLDHLQPFEGKYNASFDSDQLKNIHSIEFVNSMCIIRKKNEANNVLGPRVIAGDEFFVYDEISELESKLISIPEQSQNPFSRREKDPVLEIEEKNHTIDSMLKEKKELEQNFKRLTDLSDTLLEDNKKLEQQFERTKDLEDSLILKDRKIHELTESINEIGSSTSWKVTSPFRWVSGQLKFMRQVGIKVRLKQIIRRIVGPLFFLFVNLVKRNPKSRSLALQLASRLGFRGKLVSTYNRLNSGFSNSSGRISERLGDDYALWSQCFDTPSQQDLKRLDESQRKNDSILVIATFDLTTAKFASDLAKSLVESVGQKWEAILVFSDQEAMSYWKQKIDDLTNCDPRINYEIPQSDYSGPLMLVDGGVILRSHTLRVFGDALAENEGFCLVYSDEDHRLEDLSVTKPWFKPEFSPLLAKQGRLLGKAIAVQSDISIWKRVAESVRSRNFDFRKLALSLCVNVERKKIKHLPSVLYHNSFIDNRVIALERPVSKTEPSVSVIIPTRDRWDLLGPCLESIKTTIWPEEKLEIIIVDNGSEDRKTLKMLDFLELKGQIRVIKDKSQFNWSRLNNLAAKSTSSELLIFLNNDTEITDPLWVKKLAAYALGKSVGAVGCKLLFPDRTVQHGGVVAGIQGVAGHGHLFIGESDAGYCGLANLTREVSAVTGACLAVEKTKFDKMGGFNEDFPVAFNDVIFCFDLIANGFDNIYLGEPLIIHHESKSRGYDDNPEKVARNRAAAMLAWEKHPDIMRDDPFYSPNLSLYSPYTNAEAPRRKPAWRDNSEDSITVLLLSSTHAIGHGVPAVLALQAEHFVKAGFRVVVGGPESENDFPYPGCERIVVHDPLEATCQAALRRVDVIIPHTPPFFSVSRWTGNYPVVVCYDHGEPPANWFPDCDYRKETNAEKDFALTMATHSYAISDAIAAESRTKVDGVIPEGNTHLGQWDDAARRVRERIRAERGWNDKFIVLDVCRFHEGERIYKGVNKYANVFDELKLKYGSKAQDINFVLCGKGSSNDVVEMQNKGLSVYANVTDEEMYSLYCASDAYMNFSKWEGFNLGIAQALAMGLPTLASDIAAHRAFEISVTDEIDEACDWVMEQLKADAPREAKLMPWERSLEKWVDLIKRIVFG